MGTWEDERDRLEAEVNRWHAEAERQSVALSRSITFTCHACGEYFDEPIRVFADSPAEIVLAPTLCVDCGHSEDDDDHPDPDPGYGGSEVAYLRGSI